MPNSFGGRLGTSICGLGHPHDHTDTLADRPGCRSGGCSHVILQTACVASPYLAVQTLDCDDTVQECTTLSDYQCPPHRAWSGTPVCGREHPYDHTLTQASWQIDLVTVCRLSRDKFNAMGSTCCCSIIGCSNSRL